VKADWTSDLTVSQLRLCDKEFIDKDYEGREADLIYEVTKADGSRMFLFILQELQSTVDNTMVFRVMVYVVNNLLRIFLSIPKEERERKEFKLPAMVPIVFYNGTEKWSAPRSLREYQMDGKRYGNHILNLEYYLIELSSIEEAYILSSNTVIDNIMYCDKYCKKGSVGEALKTAYGRVDRLNAQERTEFERWVKRIFFTLCLDKEAVLAQILSREGKEEDNMAFKHNLERVLEEQLEEAKNRGWEIGITEGRAEGIAEGKAEDIMELLEEHGEVPNDLRERILEQKNLDTLKKWHRLSAKSSSIQEFIDGIAHS
jgi:hypothetical protein